MRSDETTSRLSLVRTGEALSLTFGALYLLCVAWDAIFPAEAMRSVWGALLPGWDWLGVGDFLLGLGEVAIYGWILAAIFVPIWNALGTQPRLARAGREKPLGHAGTAHAH